MKVRKRPIEVDAIRLTPELLYSVPVFQPIMDGVLRQGSFATIDTLEGTMRANIGDWIITGVQGEKYPCKPDIFEKTYEPI
jgi:hypothetical protein